MSALVYRCYDENDVCLYVGATRDLEGRLHWHRVHATWAADLADVVVTDHASMADALAVEAAEIRLLRPRWNINGRGPRSRWGLADYVEVMFAVDARRDQAWKTENSDAKVIRLAKELRRRFPDVADQVLADVMPHLTAQAA